MGLQNKDKIVVSGHTAACKGFLDRITKQEYSFLEHKQSPFYSLRAARTCIYGYCDSADV